MKIGNIAVGLAALALGAGSAPVVAQQQDTARIAELERRIEAVSREVERLRLGAEVVAADAPAAGLGPAASKVYRVRQGVSVAGYGEVLYENFAADRQDGSPSGVRDRVDALRAVLYVGYKFNDRILFNSEIELEHADEVGLEFAYVDYRFNEHVGVRGGLLLAPMGLVNELHEPPTFLGTERPVTETVIIPTTWRENGVGLFGGTSALAWRVYLMNSFDGTGFGAAGIRGGRQKGARALAEDLGVVGRLDYVGRPGLLVGASAFAGQTAQGREHDGEPLDAGLVLWDVHAEYRVRGLEVRALAAGARVNEPVALNDLSGLRGDDGVARDMLGWYVQAGYDVLHGTGSPHQLIPYARYEKVDTQRTVAPTFTADPANDLSVLSLGAAWKPLPQVVAKLGYQVHGNAADTGVNQWNVQLGWLF